MYRGFKTVHDYLKDRKLLAVPYDERCCFRAMKTTYLDKLNEIVGFVPFEALKG